MTTEAKIIKIGQKWGNGNSEIIHTIDEIVIGVDESGKISEYSRMNTSASNNRKYQIEIIDFCKNKTLLS